MYKALNIQDNTEIVILDPKWLRAIHQIRELDHRDLLVCQGCRQPVRVRAGKLRRKHFAHKHLANCDYADESETLHNARAVLYEWLVTRFGENVTIEKKVESIDLFRPIDCWVQQGPSIFAYWIFDSTLKPEKRGILQSSAKKLGIPIHWVFCQEMLRTEQDHPEKLILSTTEREFIQPSRYDKLFTGGYSTKGSLHYLDADNRKLLTARGLALVHQPQVYQGFHMTSDLEKVQVSPQDGEFVHDGEHDKLQNYEQQLMTIGTSPNRRWERFALERSLSLANRPLESQNSNSDNESDLLDTFNNKSENQALNEISPQIYPGAKTGTCLFCGKSTQDWWWYDGKTGHCKCRSCLSQGKS